MDKTVFGCTQTNGLVDRFFQALTADPCASAPSQSVLLGCLGIWLALLMLPAARDRFLRRASSRASGDLPEFELHEVAGQNRINRGQTTP